MTELPLGCEGGALLWQQIISAKRSAVGSVTWDLCNQITRRRKTTILFPYTDVIKKP